MSHTKYDVNSSSYAARLTIDCKPWECALNKRHLFGVFFLIQLLSGYTNDTSMNCRKNNLKLYKVAKHMPPSGIIIMYMIVI